MELANVTRQLMPSGKPEFSSLIKYPQLNELVKDYGQSTVAKLILLQLKDFCSSMNVVRNMNEDQMIECAAMLLDERENFRLEDFTIMLNMAKRGQLVEIRDRIDISVITAIFDRYWVQRKRAGQELQEAEDKKLSQMGDLTRAAESMAPAQREMNSKLDSLAGAMGDLKQAFTEWRDSEPKKPTP